MTVVNLSLISHTNAGKTTLTRTLLRQDVGEVRDAAHVTMASTGYPMLTAGDDALMLWDTPGFGDTGRLVKRLRLSGNPLGWLLTQVWDRFRDRAMFASQQAVSNAREQADVILYLVNAGEDPADAGYVPLEMEVLGWIGKPVLLLLNQVGAPTASNADEEARWRGHLAAFPQVRGALTLDAFARCWVQEGALLERVEALLDDLDKRAAMVRLRGAWREASLTRLALSADALAAQLLAAARDREPVGERGFGDRLRGAVASVRGGDAPPEERRAARALAERLDAEVRRSTETLLELHGLSGRATGEVLRRVELAYANTAPVKAGLAAMLGGAASGAVGGLAADAVAGGLTLGGGALLGAILGALGAGGLARGVNMVAAGGQSALRWDAEVLLGLTRSALLRYLAVAHFGRGRGEWAEGEHPAHWQAAVEAEVTARRDALKRLLARDEAAGALAAELRDAIGRLLTALYPGSAPLFGSDPAEHRQDQEGDER